MQRKFFVLVSVGCVMLLSVAAVLAQGPQPRRAASSLTTGFTYQGQLKSSGAPVNGMCDIAFSLYDASSSGNLIGTAMTTTIPITNGLFTTLLDFGPSAFNGDARWLDMRVHCPADAVGIFTALTSRQALTPAPMALTLPGLWTQQNPTSPNLIGGFSGNDISLAVVGGTIGGGGQSSSPNKVQADYGTVAGGDGNIAGGSNSTVGGGYSNTATSLYATIGGGNQNNVSGNTSTVGGGFDNRAGGISASIGGGSSNRASSDRATVSGGDSNQANGFAATVGGGSSNTAGTDYATVSGGSLNIAIRHFATVGGGYSNTATSLYATIGGGNQNNVNGDTSTVGGGFDNRAGGTSAGIGGGSSNRAPGDRATVSGGDSNQANGFAATVGGGSSNTAGTDYATVSGGSLNTANRHFATVGGGYSNTATSLYATIGGGNQNYVNGDTSTVGGGFDNRAGGTSASIGGGSSNRAPNDRATVGGGDSNQANGFAATVSGGFGNIAAGDYSMIAGGLSNGTTGFYSFAAGRHAKANHAGAFVWADSTDADFVSKAPNQFLVRASGGVTLYSNLGATIGAALLPGSSSWSVVSDRSAKMNFSQVDGREVLARLASIPVETWSYKTQDASIRHIGPMAQDFHAAFGVGENDTTISTVDAQGVALAAIQGLNNVVQTQDARIAQLEAAKTDQQQQIADLRTRLSALERTPSTGGNGSSAAPAGLSPEWLVIGALALMNMLIVTVVVVFVRRGARA